MLNIIMSREHPHPPKKPHHSHYGCPQTGQRFKKLFVTSPTLPWVLLGRDTDSFWLYICFQFQIIKQAVTAATLGYTSTQKPPGKVKRGGGKNIFGKQKRQFQGDKTWHYGNACFKLQGSIKIKIKKEKKNVEVDYCKHNTVFFF